MYYKKVANDLYKQMDFVKENLTSKLSQPEMFSWNN